MEFRGFFSYAHADSSTDPDVFEVLSEELTVRVQQHLVNASFSLWRDTKKLRLADKWSDEIQKAVSEADVFIAVISPSWISSTVCRREYNTFLSRHNDYDGEDVIPSIISVVIRDVESQAEYFDDAQTEIYADIKSRQYTYKKLIDIKSMTQASRSVWVDKIADDIGGVLGKKRAIRSADNENSIKSPIRFTRSYQPKEFNTKAYNFEEVDFISDHDLFLKASETNQAKLYGQFDFVDRLYVDAPYGRVEFGVRRAMLAIEERNGNKPTPSSHIRASSPTTRYLRLHDNPNALTISIDPPAGMTTLGELSLPPGPSATDNRFAELGSVPATGDLQLAATLTVNLNTEGIFVRGQSELKISNAQMSKIGAILVD